MDLDVRHLRYFVTVADTGNVSRAAEQLHLAQPPLSQAIRKLEAFLGLELFHRHPRGVTLTPGGQAFYDAAVDALAAADHALDTARRYAAGKTGTLRVGFLSMAANEHTPHILRAFRQAHPDIHVTLRQSGWDDPTVGLYDNNVDVAFVRLPIGHTDLIATTELFTEDCVAVVAVDHPLANHPTVTMDQIVTEPFVISTCPPGPFREFWLATSYRTQHTPASIGSEHTHADEWLAAIAAGDGISLCPAATSRYSARPDVAYITISDPPVSTVAVAWRTDHNHPIVATFVDLATAATAATS